MFPPDRLCRVDIIQILLRVFELPASAYLPSVSKADLAMCARTYADIVAEQPVVVIVA